MSHPYPPFGTQDLRDDDPQVIDDLVQATSAPADIHGAIEPFQPPPDVKANPVTRLQANTIQFYIGNAAYPLLGEDPNRLNCHVKVFSLNDTAANITRQDYVIVCDEKGKVSGGAVGINVVVHHGEQVSFDGHTGALWVVPAPFLTAFIEVSAWGVTALPDTKINPL